ncbi:MAG: alpha/beta hydrolase [Lachnospiraceae bacterium]|nr:alpha/beta hydrolase [Lachnospiraceae bacterium]
MKILLIIVLVVVVLILVASYYCMYYLLVPKVRSMEEGRIRETEWGNWGDYDSYEKEDFAIKSFDDYVLHGTLVKNTLPNSDPKKFAIITHGYTSNRYGSLRYIPTFYELGYQICIYDDRHHGENKRCYTTMGYKEQHDLIEVKNYLQDRFGSDIKIGILGESLGCAISLLSLALTQDFMYCIADCGYADLGILVDDLIGVQMHLPKFLARLGDVWCRIIHGFSFYAIKPYKALKDNKVPILFIHGADDDFIDKKHSQMNYDAAVSCEKEIHFFPGANHAESCMSDREGYKKIAQEFIKKHEK